jgi:hypothetical protein
VQQQLGEGVALGSRMVQRELVLKREKMQRRSMEKFWESSSPMFKNDGHYSLSS